MFGREGGRRGGDDVCRTNIHSCKFFWTRGTPALREYELHNPHIDETQEHDGAVDNQPHVVAEMLGSAVGVEPAEFF